MFGPDVDAAIKRVSARYGVDPQVLQAAIADESAQHLADVLGLSLAEAQTRMARVQRVLTMQSDWGAGCKLLTDDVTADLIAAIDAF